MDIELEDQIFQVKKIISPLHSVLNVNSRGTEDLKSIRNFCSGRSKNFNKIEINYPEVKYFANLDRGTKNGGPLLHDRPRMIL